MNTSIKNRPLKKKIRNVAYILLASLLYAFSFHAFVAPNSYAPGGVGGIVSIIMFIFPNFKFSSFLFALINVPLFIFGLKLLDKEFVFKSFAVSILITVFLAIFDFADQNYYIALKGVESITISETVKLDDNAIRLIAGVIGGMACGIALALAIKAHGSTGGMDVLGAILQKKNPHKSLASLIASSNIVIVATYFFFDKDFISVFIAILYIVSASTTCDYILKGAKKALKFEVVTNNAEALANELMEKLQHSVTVINAKGMYTKTEKQLLICVVSPRQVASFTDIVTKYPNTFAYVSGVNETIGEFNVTKK